MYAAMLVITNVCKRAVHIWALRICWFCVCKLYGWYVRTFVKEFVILQVYVCV